MNKLLKVAIRYSFPASLALLLTACPNPKKIDEYIQSGEQQKIIDKYLNAFNKSGDSKISHLSFYGVVGENGVKSIELMREGWRPEESWILHILLFQEMLEHEHLAYESIQVFDKTQKKEMLEFEYDNLVAYRKVYKLFRNNEKSIRDERLSDLKPILGDQLNVKKVKELIEFAPIATKDEFTPVNYVDYVNLNEYVRSLNCITFKVRTESGSWLYFNYVSEKDIRLKSIDLKKK